MGRHKHKEPMPHPRPVLPGTRKRPTGVFRTLAGFFFCFFWFFSIVSGFYIFLCPVLPLAFIVPDIYRRWTDIVFGMWEPYPVAMMEILFNVKIKITGSRINPDEGAIFIMNHRTRLDWNFLWAAVFHNAHPHTHSLKFILKSAIMNIPGPGWVMQACNFIFINRNWHQDQILMARSLDYLSDTKRSCQILIFPEGTDLTQRSLEKSHLYAEQQKLPKYHRVLLPKTTGFVFLVDRMRHNDQLRAVYDFTIAYPKSVPETELDLLLGRFPEELHFNIERYSIDRLPYESGKLKQWLYQIWNQKEHALNRFYINGCFTVANDTPDCAHQNSTNERLRNGEQPIENAGSLPYSGTDQSVMVSDNIGGRKERTGYYGRYPGNTLYMALMFWTGLVFIFFYSLYTSNFFFMLSVFYTLVYISLTMISNGMHQIIATYVKPPVDFTRDD